MNITDNRIDRFPGPKPYQEKEKDIFFGRTKEIHELYNSIVIYDIMLLHAESGLGKSSLINAGLIPILKQDNYVPITFRFKDRNEAPLQNVLNEIKNYLIKVYELNEDDIAEQLNKIPSEHHLWYLIRLLCKGDKKIVMIFDQFEEFSLVSVAKKESFMLQLSESLAEMPPDFFKKKMKEPKNDYDDDVWYQKPSIKCLFSIRSDKLYVIEEIARYFPAIARNRIQLMPISWELCKQLVHIPTQLEKPGEDMQFTTRPFNIADDVIENIVSQVKDIQKNSIESTQLQMICQEIEAVVKIRQGTSNDIVNITSEDFSIDKLKGIVTEFYASQLKKLGENKEISNVEYNAIRQLIEKKMLISNIRVPNSRAVVIEHFTDYASRNGETILESKIDEIINILLEQRLLRDQVYGDIVFYEIPHDTLKEGIKQERDKREKLEKEKAERKEKKIKLQAARLAEEKQKAELEEKNRHIREVEKARELAYESERNEKYLSKKLKKTFVITGIITSICILLIALIIYTAYARVKKDNENEVNASIVKAKDSLSRMRNFQDSIMIDSIKNLVANYQALDTIWSNRISSANNTISNLSKYQDSFQNLKMQKLNLEKSLIDIKKNGNLGDIRYSKLLAATYDSQIVQIENERIKQIKVYEEQKEYSSWFKVGYYLQFEDIKIFLKSLNKAKNSIEVEICEAKIRGICNKKIIKTNIVKGQKVTFSNNNRSYELRLDRIGNEGYDIFKPAADVTLIRLAK